MRNTETVAEKRGALASLTRPGVVILDEPALNGLDPERAPESSGRAYQLEVLRPLLSRERAVQYPPSSATRALRSR